MPIKVYTIKEPQSITYVPSYEAFFEIQGPQQEKEDCFPALYPPLDNASTIFYKLEDVPDALCIIKNSDDGFNRFIQFKKDNWGKIADILFPEKKDEYQAYIDYIEGEIVEISVYAD